MGHKEHKPWSFGLLGGHGGKKSIITFIVILVIAILTHIVGAVSSEFKDQRSRPVLALKSMLRDVREFVRTEKKMPSDLRELETKVWNKTNQKSDSVIHGNNIYVADNYEYVYFSGNASGVTIVNIWAIPLGKYRDDYETVLMVIAPEGENVWRGPALNDAQQQFVLEKGFNPTFPQMANLNMKKDADASPKEKKGFSFFK